MNKHLYILSILSFFKKTKDSFYYKFISYTIKLVILINLVISSGLFFSALDLQEPISALRALYFHFMIRY